MAKLIKNAWPTEKTISSEKIAVHKFGGSSLATSERLLNVVNIIKNKTDVNDFVVVSANGRITDWLVEFYQGKFDSLNKINAFYQALVAEILLENKYWFRLFEEDIKTLANHQAETQLSEDEVLGYGELWSARLLTELLVQYDVPALNVDAREILKTDSLQNHTHFDYDYFISGLKKISFGNYSKRKIVTGFIACDSHLKMITLGRNGSDFSATLLAAFLKANSVTLWTDVCGIYTADPRLISKAYPLEKISFNEAKALALIGTNVLHHKTIAPLIVNNTPLCVKSSIFPEEKGTLVFTDTEVGKIKSLAIKENLKLANIKKLDLKIKENFLQALYDRHIDFVECSFLQKKSNAHEAFSHSDTKQYSSFNLLVSQDSLDKFSDLCGSFCVLYDLLENRQTLVSIVSENIYQNEKLLSLLDGFLGSEYCGNYLVSKTKNLVNIIISDEIDNIALNALYDLAFSSNLNVSEVALSSGTINQQLESVG